MAKTGISFITMAISAFVLMSLSACHTQVKAPQPFAFKDEKSMQDAMKGSWILQEYADSIDAGMTPKLLEFMIIKSHAINYFPNGKNLNEVQIGDKNDKDSEVLSVDFDFKLNKISIYQKGATKDSTGKPQGAIVAEFNVNDGDTVLQFQRDSADGKVRDYVKYDITRCPDVSAYEHLANSKFISGKYYSSEDKDHIHNIVLTKCGNIQGAENISVSMTGYDHYTPLVESFGSEGDRLTLTGANNIAAKEMYWAINKDSLILTSTMIGRKVKPIVLLRKQ